jgi:hypothetical protein
MLTSLAVDVPSLKGHVLKARTQGGTTGRGWGPLLSSPSVLT